MLKQKDIIKQKEYILKVRDANTAGKVFFSLEKIELSNASIQRVSHSEIEKISEYIQNHNTVVGAPFLKKADYAVFACAAGGDENVLSASAHLKMMGAVQPFISGAISKTVNLPSSATVQDIEDIYMQAWRLKLKSISVYRDGSKMSQPLAKNNNPAGVVCVECG